MSAPGATVARVFEGILRAVHLAVGKVQLMRWPCPVAGSLWMVANVG